MMTIGRIGFGLASGAALAGCLFGTASAQDDDLVGSWSCSTNAEDADTGMTMNIEFDQTYDSDGTYERAGKVQVAVEAFQVDVAFTMQEAGTWRRDAMVLAETMTEIELTSADESPTQISQFMLQQMQADAESDIAKEETLDISSLSAATLVLDQDDGVVTRCERSG